MKQNNLVSGFAIFIGAFLVLEGIQELFNPVIYGVLTSTPLHGIVHIALGLVGLFTGLRGGARGFCIFLGALLCVVDLLWYLSATNGLVVHLFNVNQAVAILNLIVGLLSLAIAFLSPRAVINEL